MRQTFAAHDGHEVDNQGDSFFVAFSKSLDTVLAAAQAQQALFVHPWPEGGAVRVRMGLHTGEPLLTEDRDHYLGLDVHQAARIEAAAHGGQVLLSAITARLLEGRLPEEMELRRIGELRLKDFEQPESHKGTRVPCHT
ncbi:MAG: adenylate/guanylate cyclase domain-containing protein [Dehalococcoidia bacterium]